MPQSNLLTQAQLGVGEPLPLGLTRTCDGFNLAIFSRHASAVSVLLFDPATDSLIETLTLDPERNRTGDIWHVALTDQAAGKAYALKVDGPWAPERKIPIQDARVRTLAEHHCTDLARICCAVCA